MNTNGNKNDLDVILRTAPKHDWAVEIVADRDGLNKQHRKHAVLMRFMSRIDAVTTALEGSETLSGRWMVTHQGMKRDVFHNGNRTFPHSGWHMNRHMYVGDVEKLKAMGAAV